MKRLIALLVLVVLSFTFATADLKSDCENIFGDEIVSYWKFDNNLEDSISRYNGVWVGTLRYNTIHEGVIGDGMLDFDGTNSVKVTHNNNLNFDGEDFTIQFWFYLSTSLEEDFTSNLIDKEFYKITLSGEFDIDLFEYVSRTLTATVSGVSISTEVASGWNFVTLVVDRPNTFRLYVNGTEIDEETGPFTGTSSDDLKIGEGFFGYIDELAMFSTAHNENMINADYSKGRAGNDYCIAAGEDYSGTRSDFVILGCTNDVVSVFANKCSNDRNWYCNYTLATDNWQLLNTFENSSGCTRGLAIPATGVSFCCPRGYECRRYDGDIDEESYDGYRCKQMTVDCGDYEEESTCEENNCYWMGEGENAMCVHNPSDYGCNYYKNESTCEDDVWNLGREGLGTEVCGTYKTVLGQIKYSIPFDSCRCVWTSGECKLAWDTNPDLYGTTGNRNNFTCNKLFEAGACIEGEQLVNWTALVENGKGIFSGIDDYDDLGSSSLTNDNKILAQSILNSTGCKDGGVTRSCGNAIVKLPGFSFFATFLTSMLIAVFYLMFRKETNHNARLINPTTKQ